MTGRITDAYSNIATVKLFSHGSREAAYAKRSMEDFMVTVHAQMRLATSLDTLTYAANILLTLSTAVLGIILWKKWSSWRGCNCNSNRNGITSKWTISLDYVGVCTFV